MIAVISGDIIASRKLEDQNKWLVPFKNLLSMWDYKPTDWYLERGDFFQIEIAKPEDTLIKALEIKALVKNVMPQDGRKKRSSIDVRMAIGIGEKTYTGKTIAESNGPAFIYSGEKFDALKKENMKLGVKTAWQEFDEEINLYLKLAGLFMDRWSVSSAELVQVILHKPHITQEEVGKKLGIKQSGVSRRWNRANVHEILEVNRMFQKRIKSLL